MPAWTLIETRPTCGRIFQRPLDATERSFFWDANFNGTSDTLHPVELRLLNPSEDAHFFPMLILSKHGCLQRGAIHSQAPQYKRCQVCNVQLATPRELT